MGYTSISAVPDGTLSHPSGNPAINRWAIIFRPAGLWKGHDVVAQGVAEAPEFLNDVGHSIDDGCSRARSRESPV